jgi:hypothetical protein
LTSWVSCTTLKSMAGRTDRTPGPSRGPRSGEGCRRRPSSGPPGCRGRTGRARHRMRPPGARRLHAARVAAEVSSSQAFLAALLIGIRWPKTEVEWGEPSDHTRDDPVGEEPAAGRSQTPRPPPTQYRTINVAAAQRATAPPTTTLNASRRAGGGGGSLLLSRANRCRNTTAMFPTNRAAPSASITCTRSKGIGIMARSF